MSSNPFRDYTQFATQICEEERQRNLSANRLGRSLGEMQKHVTEGEIKLQQLRAAALAAGRNSGLGQREVERRVVALYNQCIKLLLWERDAPRLTAEQLREQQQSACWTADPPSEYLVNLINALWPLWDRVNDLAAAYDGSAERPFRENATGHDPAEGEQTEGTDEQARQNRMASLTPAVRKAYLSFQAALLMAERKDMEDWEAYKLLKQEGIEDGQGELTDYRLPAEPTWKRYLGTARHELGEQKYTPRRGRPYGKSIVRRDQIDIPDSGDE